MAETNNKVPCAICGGAAEEHGGGKTVHAYTTTSGDLRQPKPPAPPTQVIKLPGAQTNEAGAIGRLVEVLLDRGLISTPEALYIAGMGPKPDPNVTRDAGKYRDPAFKSEVLPC